MKEFRQVKTRDAVIIFGVANLMSMLIAVALVIAKEGFFKIVLGYFIPQVAYAISMFLYIKVGNISFLEAIPIKKKISPLLLALTIPITVGMLAQNMLILTIFSVIMEKLGITLEASLPVMDSFLTVIITVLVICVLPPIFEEFMFRGIFLTSLKKRGIKYAVLVSALIFALSHLNAAQLIHQFIVGIVLAYMGYKAGNIIYGIVVHLINNVLAITLPYWGAYNSIFSLSAPNIYILSALMIVGFFVLAGSLFLFKKECSSIDEQNAFEQNASKNALLCYNNKTREAAEEGAIISEEEKIIDEAVRSVRDNPPKLVDLWILGLCIVLVALIVFVTILA